MADKEDRKRVWVTEDLLEGLRVNCRELDLLNPTQEFRLNKRKKPPSDSELVESALISFLRIRIKESTPRPKKAPGWIQTALPMMVTYPWMEYRTD